MRTREDQIREIAAVRDEVNPTRTGLEAEKWAEQHILEAERRAEQRVREECKEEISALRKALSECASLTDGFASPECSITFLCEHVPDELRLYIEGIKSKIGKDSQRLDWLLAHTYYGIPGFDPCVRGSNSENRKADLIQAIDTAMEAKP